MVRELRKEEILQVEFTKSKIPFYVFTFYCVELSSAFIYQLEVRLWFFYILFVMIFPLLVYYIISALTMRNDINKRSRFIGYYIIVIVVFFVIIVFSPPQFFIEEERYNILVYSIYGHFLWLIPYYLPIRTTITRNKVDETYQFQAVNWFIFGLKSYQSFNITPDTLLFIKKNSIRKPPFSLDFIFHKLEFLDGNQNIEIKFLPFSEKGDDILSKLLKLFTSYSTSDGEIRFIGNYLKIEYSIIRVKNLFTKRLFGNLHVYSINHNTEFSIAPCNNLELQHLRTKGKQLHPVSRNMLIVLLSLGIVITVVYLYFSLIFVLIQLNMFFFTKNYILAVYQLPMTITLIIADYFMIHWSFISALLLLVGHPTISNSGELDLKLYYRLGKLKSTSIKIPLIFDPIFIERSDQTLDILRNKKLEGFSISYS